MYDELNAEINSVTMQIYELSIKLKCLNTLSLRQSLYLTSAKKGDMYQTITSLRKDIDRLLIYKEQLIHKLDFISNINKCRGL